MGTVLFNERGQLLGDLDDARQSAVIARGGAGGSAMTGSTHEDLHTIGASQRHTGPLYPGKTGEDHHVVLELKSIADVGLVGFPNAGKSSLLRRVSRATPKVASYAFTTLRPNIGVIEFGDFHRVRVADIPGLIEGAHDNHGMGHAFLRHVERTRVLLYVVDVHGFRLRDSEPHRDAYQCLTMLRRELELYNGQMLAKPSLIAVNKMDISEAPALLNEFKAHLIAGPFKHVPVVPVSLLTGFGVDELKAAIRQTVGVTTARKGPEHDVEAFRRSLYGLSAFEADKFGRVAGALRLATPKQAQ